MRHGRQDSGSDFVSRRSRSEPGTDITQEIHGAVAVGGAVASPGHDLEGQHAEAEDVDLGRHAPVHRVLWRHVAAAEDACMGDSQLQSST